MTAIQPPELIKLLAHDLRWTIIQALTLSDCRVQELAELTGEPLNLVSYHLKRLRSAGVISARRSEADRRDTYYALEFDRLRQMYQAAGRSLHPVLGALTADVSQPVRLSEPVRVLFICTHNSVRSQMAEGWMRHLSAGAAQTFSAGSAPTEVHPDAVRTMARCGVNIQSQQAKPLDRFSGQTFDYVITVCDRARELCPAFPGGQTQIHWGLPDPLLIEDDRQRALSFSQIAENLRRRILYFLHTVAVAA